MWEQLPRVGDPSGWGTCLMCGCDRADYAGARVIGDPADSVGERFGGRGWIWVGCST